MICAVIFECDPKTHEHNRNLGEFDFVQLPAPGDEIEIARFDDKVSLYQVIKTVQHVISHGNKLPHDQ